MEWSCTYNRKARGIDEADEAIEAWVVSSRDAWSDASTAGEMDEIAEN